MGKLLKHDFYRIFRSKLALISAILCVALPFGVAFLFKMIGIISGEDESLAAMLNANYLFTSAYSLTSNIGIVIPVFASIFVINDLKQGSSRNKVICGYRKSEIYFTQLIVTLCYVLALITVYAGLNFFLGGLMFSMPDFTVGNALRDFLRMLGMGTCIFVFATSLVMFGAYATKNIALTIIIAVGTTMLLTILNTVLDLVLMNVENSADIMCFVPLYGYSRLTGYAAILAPMMDSETEIMTSTQYIISIVSLVGFSGMNVGFGYLIFKNRDLN